MSTGVRITWKPDLPVRYTNGFWLLEAFFFPNVSVVVVPGFFPEPRAVMGHEFQTAQPFGAFPEIRCDQIVAPGNGADHAAQRVTVVWADWLAVIIGRQQEILCQRHLERDVDRKTVFGVLHYVMGARQRLENAFIDECADCNTLPGGIHLTPARDAVNIHKQGGFWQ